MAKLNYSYGINEIDSMKALIADTAKAWSIVSGDGIDAVTIVGGDGKASIQGSTLYIDTGDNFDSSTFITGASVTGAEASIQNNTLFIEVPTVDTSTFITQATINSGTVTISGNTLGIDIPTIAPSSGVTDVSVVAGDILASIDSGTLYLLGADPTTPKASANLSIPATITAETGTIATITASHLGDGILNFAPAPDVTISSTQYGFRVGEKNIYIITSLSETAEYYAAMKDSMIQVTEPASTILFPFQSDLNDTKGLFYRKPTDTKAITFAEGGVKGGFTLFCDSFVIGGQDFTFDWWQKLRGHVPWYMYLGTNCFDENYSTAEHILTCVQNQGRWIYQPYFDFYPTLPSSWTEWQRLTWTYDHSTGIHRYFANGKLLATHTATTAANVTPGCVLTIENFQGNTPADVYLKNFRIIPDRCLYTADFEVV